MKKETFLGTIILIGIWLLANWFKLAVVILLIIICNDLTDLNTNTSYMDDMDFQMGGIRSMDSDIRDNTSNIDANTKRPYQYNMYPPSIQY